MIKKNSVQELAQINKIIWCNLNFEYKILHTISLTFDFVFITDT